MVQTANTTIKKKIQTICWTFPTIGYRQTSFGAFYTMENKLKVKYRWRICNDSVHTSNVWLLDPLRFLAYTQVYMNWCTKTDESDSRYLIFREYATSKERIFKAVREIKFAWFKPYKSLVSLNTSLKLIRVGWFLEIKKIRLNKTFYNTFFF